MSNIAVVPCSQKPWALNSTINYAGTATYTVLLANSSAPFIAPTFPLPPWASTTMYVPPLSVYPSIRDPAPVLSPFTVLLLILGLYDIAPGVRTCDPRAPYSFSASSYRSRTRPGFGHNRSCSIDNFLPQPSQVAGIS